MNYHLKDYAEFSEYEGGKCGVLVSCPNCGLKGAAYFDNMIGGDNVKFRESFLYKTRWARTGETLETLTLSPSFLMIGHYHSWIRNGMLCVDSAFSCKADSQT